MVKQRKKVLFTSHVANFQKFNRPFMRMLSAQGYEVHYASMGEEEILDCDKSFVVPFTRSPFGLSNIAAYKQLKEIIDREHYDIIHTHTPMGGVVTRLAARAARKKGTRVIYTAHGFHFFKGAPILNWLIYYPVERYMARHTDTLITINKEDYERAKAQFKTNVQYVPGVGIDPKKFDIRLSKKQRKDLRAEFGISENDFVMIYVAELSKRKNQLWLIKSLRGFLAEHSDAHLLLPGADSLNGAAHELAKRLNLQQQIHLPGYRSDIPHLMKASDIAVSASRQEGLPVNIMEAMYLGLPVIATDCRGNRDVVTHQLSGVLISHKDGDSLIDSLLTMHKNRWHLDKFSKVAKRSSREYVMGNILPMMKKLYCHAR
jgi:glycosyltransferase EpsD